MAIQELEWIEELEHFVFKFSDVANKERQCDVIFQVGSKSGEELQYYAHKSILEVESSVFEAMFLRADNKRVIVITDVTAKGFHSLLRHIYKEVVSPESVIEALDILYAARKYLIPLLEKQCERYIFSNATPTIACRVFEFAVMMNLHSLRYRCLKLFDEKICDVLASKDFETSQLHTMQTIVRRPFLTTIYEIHIFRAVLSWAKEECSRKGLKDTCADLRKVLNPLLPDFRFLNMTSHEFTSEVLELGILTQEEAFPILVKLVKPRSTIARMPTAFFNRRKRRFPITHCAVQTHENRLKDPVKLVDSHEQFALSFELRKNDVFLLGMTIPLLLSRCCEGSSVTLNTKCRYISAKEYLADFNHEIMPDHIKEAVIPFPDPLLIRKEESVEIISEVISRNCHPFVHIYKYDLKKKRVEWGDTEFVLLDDQPETSAHQISSLQMYY